MSNLYVGLTRRGAPSMPPIVADPPLRSCYRLFPAPGIQESQRLGPDPFLPSRTRARGRSKRAGQANPPGLPSQPLREFRC
jgi:hypothetical protein